MTEHHATEAGPPVLKETGGGWLASGNLSLRNRILLLLALTFAAMLGMTSYLAYTERTAVLAEANDRVQRVAKSIADANNGAIDALQKSLDLLTEAHDFREFGPTPWCQQLLSSMLDRDSRLANILYVAPNGDVVCNGTPTAFPVNVADRTYFLKALASESPVIDKAVVGRSTGKLSLPFAKAIRDNKGQVQGVMLAALDLKWVAREFDKTKLPEGAKFGLVDHDGTVLVRVPDPEKWVGRNASHTAFFKSLLARSGVGTAEATGLGGERRIFGFARFTETTAGPIYLWVGVTRESVVRDANNRFAWALSDGLLLAVLAFGLTWLGSDRLVLRPVWAMSEAARRLGEGDLGARTGLQYTGDELGRLARAFDAMAESIASREEQILQNHTELQNRAEALRAARAAALNIMEDAVEARRKAEVNGEKLRQRTVELDAANRELEAFSYSVSHDLRAPLRSIDGFSQVLEEDYAERIDGEGKDALRRVRAAAQRMSLLIDDLLMLSRLSRAEMNAENVDLSALASSIAQTLKSDDPARSVRFDIAPMVIARGDRRLLEVVLENLLGNAWKFTGRHNSARIEFGVTEKDGEPVYFVRDDGAGFDMAYAANLFTAFQRLHSAAEFPGTGIGLVTVRRIVQRHGGRVWAEGAVERGATFYFTLPARDVKTGTGKAEAALA